MAEIYIMYLRKSRQDDPNETVEEVLAKHEARLQAHAEKMLGRRIPDEDIYREVVSGESIDDRVEIQRVLRRIEDPEVRGVLVVDPQRLSRGDLEDCGRLINDLRYTSTLVVTPMMSFDPTKKQERRYLQDELLRGRDFLEYIKDTLRAGRESAVRRGCYISPTPPYGFNRIKIGKDWTLEPNENADAVRLMFEWYVHEDLSLGALARRLDSYGFKPPTGEQWSRFSLREMLKNIHYIGKVRYNFSQTVTVVEEGERVRRKERRPDDEVIIAEGKHDGLVPVELYQAAVERLKNNPRNNYEDRLVNVLAGVLVCSTCGRVLIVRSSKKARGRYMCPHKPQCQKSAIMDDVIEAVIAALETTELPKLHAKLENGDGDAAAIQKRRLAQMAKQMEDYLAQEDRQYELLETKKYTQAVFDRRNAALRQKIEECEVEMRKARANMPKNVDYSERIVSLEDAIEALKDPDVPNKEANRALRSIVDRIEYTGPPVGSKETAVKLEIFLRI